MICWSYDGKNYSPNWRISQIRVSDYLVEKLFNIGIERAFIVTGGGAMHLNDAITRHKDIKSTFMHHEQALAIAAEGFARVGGKPAIVNVTSGPGGINALNGVFGAFVDSVPMVVLSGQVRTETVAELHHKNLRQLGDQEANIFSIVKSTVKYFAMPTTKYEAIIAINKAIYFLKNGRPGPVWIDIPINVQGVDLTKEDIKLAESDTSLSPALESIHPNVLNNFTNTQGLILEIEKTIELISHAKRPIFMAGNGIHISNQREPFLRILSKLRIPAVTGWNAHDLLPNTHPSYCGKPGTVGDRAGNFSVRSSDLIVVFGCRLNIRQISYNWGSFAPDAKIVMIDVDKFELTKHTLKIDYKFHRDLSDFMKLLEEKIANWVPVQSHTAYLHWCKQRVTQYPIINAKHDLSIKLNPYAFFDNLYKHCNPSDNIVLGNGSACVIGFQTAIIQKGIRLFSNSGCASMGYDLPASIGAALSQTGTKTRTICVAGDGSLMMNIQELSTLKFLHLPIKLFILENNGYHSIRQSQQSHFPDNVAGTGSLDGLGFPNFMRIANGFELEATTISSKTKLIKALSSDTFLNEKPHIFVINLDTEQQFEPKLQSRRLDDGSMISPELHDMAPFLSKEEIKKNIIES